MIDLNLEVHDKELLTLVGPSGCGKSTTLNMLAGLEDPSEGLIYIDDRVVNDVPPGARDIAMVFQSYALYPHMTVRQNIGFGLKVRRMKKAEIARRVDEAAQFSISVRCSTGVRKSSPAASASGSRSAAPSPAIPRSSCWTNR